MPPPPPRIGDPNKKKKKGRAPAHQNGFAFRHNPKSKKTEKILASPNVGVCARCRDKIEWRKKYRKVSARSCERESDEAIEAVAHIIVPSPFPFGGTDGHVPSMKRDGGDGQNKGHDFATTTGENPPCVSVPLTSCIMLLPPHIPI